MSSERTSRLSRSGALVASLPEALNSVGLKYLPNLVSVTSLQAASLIGRGSLQRQSISARLSLKSYSTASTMCGRYVLHLV